MDSSVGKDVRISHIFHASGNAFIVALDHGILMGPIQGIENIEESVEYGSASAAIVVTKVGCAPAMPLQKEIEDFMKSNKINN